MEELAVSVIIPTYNRAPLVTRAIESALAAIAPGDEIIVVDDGSTDSTEEALAAYGDRIRYVRIPHSGAGAARNHGMQEARNPLVAFLDSDDEWMPDKLLLQRALMKACPDVSWCFSDLAARKAGERDIPKLVTRKLNRCRRRERADPRLMPHGFDKLLGPGFSFSSMASLPAGREDFLVYVGDTYPSLMETQYISIITVLVRRDLAEKALRFSEDLPVWVDWEGLGRLARTGPGAYLDCETAWLWRHGGARLTDANALIRATTIIRVLERVWGTDPVFLAQHEDRLRAKLCALHLQKARSLMRQGQMQQARQELRLAGDGRLLRRLLATLPGPFVRGVLGIYDRLKRALIRLERKRIRQN